MSNPSAQSTGATHRAFAHAWSADVGRVADSLDVDPSRGLTAAEANQRLREHGRNRLRETKRVSAARILLNQFKSLVVGLLVAAAIVSAAFARWLESAAIGVVIFINTAIGFFTELRAVRSMEALRRLSRTTTTVRRDGRAQEISAVDLAPGDVILLEAGDVITADVRLVEASKLEANESTLTGESTPVSKRTEAVDDGAPLAERASMLFKGTIVTRGSGVGIVVATGMSTELGRIAQLAGEAERAATPLQQRMERLGRRLIWLTLAIALATIIAGVLRGRDVVLMIETGIALAVAAIPEGLPIVATLALARGMWRLAKRNALINRLSAVETLGATGVILTDKTGTLTENQMTVVRLALAKGDVEIEGRGFATEGAFLRDGGEIDPDTPELGAAVEIGLLCNNASFKPADDGDDESAVVGDPTEAALLVLGAKAGLDRAQLLHDAPEQREEPFDPETRAMATFHQREGRIRVAVKGAPEVVLKACKRQLVDGEEEAELAEQDRQRWLNRSDELAAEGLRVLALARKCADSVDEAPYEDLTIVGLAGMLDPPRKGVKEALQRCATAGVRVVMVTGDQAGTALSVARSIGLVVDGEAIRGADLPEPEQMTDEDRRRLLEAAVFARVEPEQKLRLIALHQGAGSVVAMTGDGVNDAPALRKADIGVAMGRRGTQVAREAADMILQDDAFSTIVRAIHQGRVLFTNIRRFIVYLLSCNVSEIMIVGGAAAFDAPLPILPLQILYLNLVTDVFPAMALGFGRGDEDAMQRPPRDPREPIVARNDWIGIGVYGLLISASVLASLWIALNWLAYSEARAVTVSFLTLAFAQVWHVFNMRERGSGLLSNDVVRNGWVWGAIGLCALLLAAAVYVPGVSTALRTAAPGAAGWLLVLGASAAPLAIGQAWHALPRKRAASVGGESRAA